MCLYPKIIENRRYKANKKNGGVIPKVRDERALYVPVGCGNCIECRKQKGRQWMVRLNEEIRGRKGGKFITFTFTEEAIEELREAIGDGLSGYNMDNEIAKKATRRFLERWRKKYKKSVRHWFITELGHEGTERLHLHGFLWTDKSEEEVEKIWKYGGVTFGDGKGKDYVNEETINYVMKYVSKNDEVHESFVGLVLCSPGIGSGYFDRSDWKNNVYKPGGGTNETYRLRSGVKIGLPIYYRNKIYTEEEREKLWIEKLDEGLRYVDGNKIEEKDGDFGYYRALDVARMKAKRLGYTDGAVDWEKKYYENQRRNLKKKERYEKMDVIWVDNDGEL